MECGDKSPHSKRAVIVHLHWIVTRVRRTASSRHVTSIGSPPRECSYLLRRREEGIHENEKTAVPGRRRNRHRVRNGGFNEREPCHRSSRRSDTPRQPSIRRRRYRAERARSERE